MTTRNDVRLPRKTSPLSRADIPKIAPAVVVPGQRNPCAWLLGAPRQVWEARVSEDQGDRSGAQKLLEAATESSDPVVAWSAVLELGVLLTMVNVGRAETSNTREGLGLLMEAITAPYADIAGAACFNVAQLLQYSDRFEDANGYVWLAHDLGDPLALERVLASIPEDERDSVSLESFQFIRGSVSRLRRASTVAEIGIAPHVLRESSAPLREWFTQAQGRVGAEDWSSISSYLVDSAMYNVGESLRRGVDSSFSDRAGLLPGTSPEHAVWRVRTLGRRFRVNPRRSRRRNLPGGHPR